MLTRCHDDEDRRMGYRSRRGKPFQRGSAEFGECVLYLKPSTKGRDKLEPGWEEGIWLGLTDRSFEVVVGTDPG